MATAKKQNKKPAAATKKGTSLDAALQVLKNAAKGDFGERIETAGSKELGSLFTHMNKVLSVMNNKVESLNKCNIELEESIEDIRTKEQSMNTGKILEETIISSLGEGLVVVDEQNRVSVMNRQAEKIFGYENGKNFIGKDYRNLISWVRKSGRPISPESDPIRDVFETGKKVSISLGDDFYCLRKNKEPFPVMVSASPVRIGESTRSVVAIFHDATKEKNIDDIKSDFISIASHQLRTPLTVSSLHAEMLLSGHGGQLPSEARRYLEEIQSYNKKMAQLLNDFLVVSKIELGTFAVESKPADIAALLDDVFHEVETHMERKSIKLSRNYEENIPFIPTDPTLMRIVFQNIATNAVKYTPEEGSIHASIQKNKKDVIISIEDSGCGVPQDEQARIFSKLYRGSNVKKHDSDGSGLGLYIAKSIIEKCGGKIWFESPAKSGIGTVFYLSLPIGGRK